jgi:hypothetical protein
VKARWTVSDDVLEAFHRCTARERLQLIAHFRAITEFPDNSVHHTSRGAKGRPYLVAQAGKWEISYWIDAVGDYVHFESLQRRP